jgi:hypothetical protein
MAMRPPGWFHYALRDKCERLRDKWQQLPARKWINNKPIIIITVTCISLLILLVIAIVYFTPAQTKRIEPVEEEWFYDLNTGRLFTADSKLTPPIQAPSGPLPTGEPAGVRACVLTYAAKPNPSNYFIAFLETTDPNAQDNSPDSSGRNRWAQGRLISRPDDQYWVHVGSREGRAIMEEAFRPNPNGERPHYVRPK